MSRRAVRRLVLDQAASMPDAYQILGRPLPRIDSPDKVAGKALFAADIHVPGMLHLKALRSDRPHARILAIHTENAAAYPGVVAIFTSKDIPGVNRSGPGIKDQPVLCEDKVRRVGDAVALVAAETPEASEQAARLIEVEYEDLPGVFSPEDALAPDAAKIHEAGNLLLEKALLKGDPEQALRDAEVVITNTYRTQMAEHAYLEPEAAVASCCDGRVTVWMPSKYPHSDHRQIAGLLGFPVEKVRVILTTVGGGFGDKHCLSPGYYAALASLKTGRPAKMVYEREESFAVSTKRHPFVIHYTTGATREGRITAVKIEITADTGAYASYGPVTLVRAMVHTAGPYDIANVSVKARAVYTNNPVAGAMRGFGVPQVVVAHESQVDILARMLNIDPFEIRLKNGLKPGSSTATGQRLDNSVGYPDTVRQVREEIAKRETPVSSGSKRYGWGVASMYYGIGKTAGPNPGTARIEVEESGDVVLYLGCGDMGQGSAATMVQIAAETLKLPVEAIRLTVGDTDRCSDSGPSSASRVTYIVGRAVQLAAEQLQQVLKRTAAELLGTLPGNVAFDDRTFYRPDAPLREVSISEVVKSMKERGVQAAGQASFDPKTTALDPKTSQGDPYATYAFATQAALVAVDAETGEVDVLSIVASHDVGKAVNPLNVTGQIEGGVSMGLGYGLSEEVVVQQGGIRNPQFTDYIVPSAMDVPEIVSLIVESEEPTGPFGAKGVGEPALLPTAPAIMNAVAAATGIRVTQIPITPGTLLNLMKHP
ncbi:MAG: xanthine dehydrogenase family protein molybdopterin-binding subunit [Candidatus Korobacteraceae bacterium]